MRHIKNGRRKFPQRLPVQERLRISRIFSETAEELGHNNEKRVVDAYKETGADIPEWIRDVRIGTPEEDKIGIDLIFDTDIGGIFVQVKGSNIGVHNFKLQHAPTKVKTKIHIITVVIFPSHSSAVIRKILTPLLWKEFSRLSVERRSWSID